MNIHKNTHGFAHPVLLVVVLVGIIGLIGLAGYRVMNRSGDPKQPEVASTLPDSITITSDGATNSGGSGNAPTTISINRAGSAAAEASQQAGSASGQSLPETKQLEVAYDVSTPLGSLGQILLDAKSKRFSNVLYFITPRLMFRAYDVVKAQNLTDFAQKCQSSANCKMLMVTDVVIDKSHILESNCSGSDYSHLSGIECKEISTTVTIKDGKLITEYYKAVGYGHHKVSFYMLHAEGMSNWVLDKVTVDNFTL